MGHTFSQLFFHIIFSTKERRNSLHKDIRDDLLAYLCGIARKQQARVVKAGAVENHVHLLMTMRPKQSLSDMVRDIKANSSRWMHENHPEERDFAWQSGFSVFSVSASVAPTVSAYIENQESHHHRMSFEEELRTLLDKHGIEFDSEHYLD